MVVPGRSADVSTGVCQIVRRCVAFISKNKIFPVAIVDKDQCFAVLLFHL